MKYFNKILLPVLLLIFSLQVKGQETAKYNWQLGVGIGYTNYYGDLSNYRIHHLDDLNRLAKFVGYNKYYVDQPSLSLTLHKKVTPTLGVMLQANYLSFSMSDRYRKGNGSFDTTSMNYARSLNFRTRVQELGIAFTFNGNNGKMFSENAFFYPSVYLGAGVSKFVVKGDLYDENGAPYNYLLPGNIQDGIYETNLRNLRTETEERYPNVIPYADLGLALNFRVHELFTISLQSDIKYSASDFLDDVSRKYKDAYATPAEQYAARPGYNAVNPVTLQRGDDNSMNDFYINNRVVFTLGLSSGSRTKSRPFNAPAIYALDISSRQRVQPDSLAARAQRARQDSIPSKKADSLAQQTRDSLAQHKRDSVHGMPVDSTRAGAPINTSDTNVQNQLKSITDELREIKLLLRDQATRPRYQQLQFQMDSIRAVSNRVRQQRSVSREDNLRLRIYALQLDSLQHEMQRLEWNRENPSPSGRREGAYDIMRDADAINATQPGQPDTVLYQALTGTDGPEDTVAFRPDVTRIDSLQQRLYELQMRMETGDTTRLTREEESESAEAQPVADTAALNDTIAAVESRLRQNADSVTLLRTRLRRSNDSAAYYRRIAFAAADGKTADTVVKKKTFLKRIFESEKKKRRDEEAADTVDRYTEQQRYYDQDVERMQKRIDDMERRNRQLEEEYESLDQRRNRWRRDDSYQAPLIIRDRNDNARVGERDYNEYLSLRAELDRLRNDVNNANQRNNGTAGYTQIPTLPASPPADTVTIAVQDSVQFSALRSQLDQMRNELDSLRNDKPPAVAAKPSFDVHSFPVISVYFNMGSASLTSDQAGKINPFGSLAVSHPEVNIVLKGFTDPVGNPAVNTALARKRTAFVKNILTTRFRIDEKRIIVEEPSIAAGGRRRANPLDRRVDLNFEAEHKSDL